MRVSNMLTNPQLWRVGENTRRTLELYFSYTDDFALLQKLRGASWDVFHDPALGTFDRIRIAREALASSPDPIVAVRRMIF